MHEARETDYDAPQKSGLDSHRKLLWGGADLDASLTACRLSQVCGPPGFGAERRHVGLRSNSTSEVTGTTLTGFMNVAATTP
jgi:hypothetical protein